MSEGYHHLPIRLLLATLRDIPQTVSLQASLSPQRGLLKKGATAELLVQNGEPISCKIKDLHGSFLSQDQEALNFLQLLGTQAWLLSALGVTGQEGVINAPQPLSARPEQKPIRKVLYSPSTLLLRQRQVFNLADGTRTPWQIATLLHLSPREVEAILLELHKLNLISY